MDYASLCFEDVLRLVTRRLDLDTARPRSEKADSFLAQLSNKLKQLTEAGHHVDLLQWLDSTDRRTVGKQLIEEFIKKVEALYDEMLRQSFTSSALRGDASTQSSSGHMGAVASSAGSTSRLNTSFASTGKTTSAKTTPNTSFETEYHSGIFKKYVKGATSPHSTIAGAEIAQTHPDERATRKRKRDQSGSHALHMPASNSAGAQSPTPTSCNKEVTEECGKTAHHGAFSNDMSHIDHKLRDLPSSNFGTMDHDQKDHSIEKVFRTKVQRLSKEACPLVLKADIKIDVRSGKPLFSSSFDVKGIERSNQLERRFGWKRFMHAVLPLESQKALVRSNQPYYRDQVKRWLMKPKSAFGCEWRAFLIKDIKAERKSLLKGTQTHSGSKVDKRMEVIFFATRGPDIEHITLNDFVHSTLHINDNRNRGQACLKLYSRFEILLSRTSVGITFTPDQFRFADDPTPTTEHDSPELRALTDADVSIHYEVRKHDKDESMTDGNAVISVGAALLIWEALGLDYQPTAFQGRILGCKGVWHNSAPYDTQDSSHTSIWIQLHKSQRKIFIEPDAADLTELTFNVTSVSFKPRAVDLHRDFLPILQDRGVSSDTIAALHSETARDTLGTWTAAIHSPAKLALLLHTRCGGAGPRRTKDVFRPWALTPAETALHFVEDGFMPCDNQYVADLLLRSYASALADDLINFRIKCPKTTSMMGITDPYGVLEPHQVFFCFSKPFKDDKADEAVCFLREGNEVIIARDPTLRASDMQKFVYSFKPQLAHLKDVVVFPIKGSMPAAAKLQGGDYDGDIFSLSWNPRLTKAFKNVPAPEPQGYEQLGIAKISTTFAELAADEGTEDAIDHFLRIAFEFRTQSNLLGMVTNYTNSFTYRHGLWDVRSTELADLHGYLIDSAKNGYTFGEGEWRMFRQSRGLEPSVLQAWKAYQEGLKALLEWHPKVDDRNLERKLRGFLREAAASGKGNLTSVLDKLWFGPMLEEAADAIRKLSNALASVRPKHVDPDLMGRLNHLCEKEILNLLDAVRKPIRNVVESYTKICHKDVNDRSDEYEKVRDEFLRIPAPDCFSGGRSKISEYSEWELILTTLLLRLEEDNGGRRNLLCLATGPICHIKRYSEIGRKRRSQISAVKHPSAHLISKMSFETAEEEGAADQELSLSSSMLESSMWSQQDENLR